MPRPASFTPDFAAAFDILNALVEPAVRGGCGVPGLCPTGLIVLETVGRRSGKHHRTPLFATSAGGYLWAGTFRGNRADWLKNALANPHVHYWLNGHAREGRALVFTPGAVPQELGYLPLAVQWTARWLSAGASRTGFGFALLGPAIPHS